MSNLLVKPSKPDSSGRIHAVTPASAGWTYVGFEVYQLRAGQSLERTTGDREACIVILSGKAPAAASGRDFGAGGGGSGAGAAGAGGARVGRLAGKARGAASGRDFGVSGGRASPFEPDPWS